MTSSAAVRTLDTDQLERFNHHLQSPQTEENVLRHLRARYGDMPFRFVDVGGGAGSFTDVILKHFPAAHGIVLDNAEYLLAKNATHPNKSTLHASVTEILQHLRPGSQDVIFLNLVLHHLVTESYAASRRLQQQTLDDLCSLLKSGGSLSVIEQAFEGLAINNLPGWLIYQATSSKTLAGFARRMKANTAGVGVCFQSTQSWQRKFATLSGMQCVDVCGHVDEGMYNHKPIIRYGLHIRSIDRVHFWLQKA